MSALADRYDSFLLDLDGVVYRADRAVPGAPRAVAELRARGRRVVFVTNNSAPTPEQVVEKLESLGVNADPEDVVTSAQAVASLVRERVGRGAEVFVIGEDGVRRALEEAGLRLVDGDAEAAEAVVVGWDRSATYDRLRRAGLLVQRGARLIAANADASYPGPGGELWPGTGALLGVIETTTGARAEVAGKPHRPLFDAAMERAGGGRALVVGDRLDTDVAGARAAGLDAAVVLSGAVGAADLLAHDALPIDVLDDLSGLLEDRPEAAPRHAGSADRDAIAALLAASGLTQTAGDSAEIVLGDGVATAAVRVHHADAYLHSVAVRSDARGKNLGVLSVAAAVAGARADGATTVWLLTEGAEGFFAGLRFERVERSELPPWTAEMTTACASTAVAMRRSV